MHEFKTNNNMHRYTQLTWTEIRPNSFLWPNIHIVFVYLYYHLIFFGWMGSNLYPEWISTRAKNSNEHEHTHPAALARPA